LSVGNCDTETERTDEFGGPGFVVLAVHIEDVATLEGGHPMKDFGEGSLNTA
jgi:hypothetical protein